MAIPKYSILLGAVDRVLRLTLSVHQMAIGAIVTALTWGLPATEAPFNTTWPYSYMRIPHTREWCGSNCVAVVPWLIMVDQSTQALLEVVFPVSLSRL